MILFEGFSDKNLRRILASFDSERETSVGGGYRIHEPVIAFRITACGSDTFNGDICMLMDKGMIPNLF